MTAALRPRAVQIFAAASAKPVTFLRCTYVFDGPPTCAKERVVQTSQPTNRALPYDSFHCVRADLTATRGDQRRRTARITVATSSAVQVAMSVVHELSVDSSCISSIATRRSFGMAPKRAS